MPAWALTQVKFGLATRKEVDELKAMMTERRHSTQDLERSQVELKNRAAELARAGEDLRVEVSRRQQAEQALQEMRGEMEDRLQRLTAELEQLRQEADPGNIQAPLLLPLPTSGNPATLSPLNREAAAARPKQAALV